MDKKKRVTIRMLSCLLAVFMIVGAVIPVFAANGVGSGKDYKTQSATIGGIGSGSGSGGTLQPDFSWSLRYSALKVSLIVTSTDGVSRYNPSLNKDGNSSDQPIYRDITPLGLSCSTKAFNGLTKNDTLGWYGVGGCYIYDPEHLDGMGLGSASGGRDIEGAVERTADGKWAWNGDNNNLVKYRIDKTRLDTSYTKATKKKDVNGNKVKINPDNKDGVTAGNLYNRFLYNPEAKGKNKNSIWGLQGDNFLKLGMVTIEGDAAQKPANQVKMAGNRAILYTLLHSMKIVHAKDNDKELNELFDKAMAATLGEDSEFKFVLMFELAEPLYRANSKDLYWLTTNNYAAASVCSTAKELKEFPAMNKGSKITAGTSKKEKGNFGEAATGADKTDNSSLKDKTNMGLLSYVKKMNGMNGGQAQKNRVSRGICGAYRYWMGQDYGSGVEHLSGLADKSSVGLNPSEKKPEVLAARLCYSGPIYNDGTDIAKRSEGFIAGKWADGYTEIRNNEYEAYKWGWGILSIEDADGGQAPVMQKAVMSSTNLSLVSTAGDEKVDSPNLNMATVVADGEHSKGYEKLEASLEKSLKDLESTGKLSGDVAKLIESRTWKHSTVSTKDKDEDSDNEVKNLTKKEIKEIQTALNLITQGFNKVGGSFSNLTNIQKLLLTYLSAYNKSSSTLSSDSGNSISTDTGKGVLLMSTTIERQKKGTSKYVANSKYKNNKQPLMQNIITAEKLNIVTDEIDVLEGAAKADNKAAFVCHPLTTVQP